MKKVLSFVLVLVIAFSMCACGAESKEPTETETPYSSVSAVSNDSPPAVEPTFDGSIYTDSDVRIEILSYEILPTGSEYNSYGEKPLIVFKYNVTNLSGATVDAMSAWLDHFKAYQDNDPNILNELAVGSQENTAYHSTASASIKKDGCVESVWPYELDDLDTPVTLVASINYGTKEISSYKFDVASAASTTSTASTPASSSDTPECTPENMEMAALLIESFYDGSDVAVTHEIKADNNLIIISISFDGLAADVNAAINAGTTPYGWEDVISSIESVCASALETAKYVCGDSVHVGIIVANDVNPSNAFLSVLDGKVVDNIFA